MQLRNKVGWLRNMKSSGAYKKDMIGLYHAVLCRDIAAFYNREHIALNTLTADVPSSTLTATARGFCYFIDFVNDNDPLLLNALKPFLDRCIMVDQLFSFFFEQQFTRLLNRYSSFGFIVAAHFTKHILQVDTHFFHAALGTKNLHHR